MSERRAGWSKGCLIALAVVGGLGLLCGGGMIWMGYAAWTSPEVQRGLAVTGAAIEVTQEGMRAPGANELRAAGCTQALALTTDSMARVYAAAGASAPPPEVPLVVCMMGQNAAPVSCEDAVRTYAGALPTPQARIAARVTVQGEAAPRCQGVYAADGAFIGEMDPMMVRVFGQIGATPSLGP